MANVPVSHDVMPPGIPVINTVVLVLAMCGVRSAVNGGLPRVVNVWLAYYVRSSLARCHANMRMSRARVV